MPSGREIRLAEKPRFLNLCQHDKEDFLGQAGEFDVYIEETRNSFQDFRICLRYGNKHEDYISGGAGNYRDCVSVVCKVMEALKSNVA